MDFINKLESKQKGYITGERALNLKKWVEENKFTNELDLILRLEGN